MGLLANRFRALRTVSMPHLKLEVERNGTVQFPAATTTGVRHFQELRGPFSCCIHGWKRCGHVGESYLLRAQGGRRKGRQEKVGTTFSSFHTNFDISTMYSVRRTNQTFQFLPQDRVPSDDLCKRGLVMDVGCQTYVC